MSRSATLVLAIVLALGSFGLSASAYACDGGYREGRAGDVRGDNFGGGFASGLHGESRSHRGRDVWGHWGAYYGPMIPMI